MSEIDTMSIDLLKSNMERFVDQVKESLGQAKTVAVNQAWKILQLAVAETVQVLEQNYNTLSGPDKKTVAMDYLSSFYDNVFTVVVIPAVPAFLQPVIKKYIKLFLMTLVSSSIDAMVTTFRQIGLFKLPTKEVSSQSVKSKPKAKRTRKKK
jgi:hypothetical protein